jgi:ABC-2 type transport system ATP-binding protein
MRRGTICALLGPNGAGKTTLVRAICGRVALDAGDLTVDGRDPRTDRSVRGSIGLVPQEIALYPYLSVRENLEVLGRLAGVGRGDLPPAVNRALDWSGLESRENDRCDSLSGGMKRRLNIVAGTLHRPRLLLLDEPTVGVDPTARDRIHDLLRDLRAADIGILLTTHDMEQAETLADRIAIIVEGRVRAEGTLSSLVRESFGDAKELRMRFDPEPPPPARELLESAGLHGSEDERAWSGNWSGDVGSLAHLEEAIREAGGRPSEVRVREPGLREVFFRVTGLELEP